MNNDEVIVTVKNARMDRFVNFSITSDLFAPEGSFSFEVDSRYNVSAGDLCSIFVNRKIVMAGIVDTVKRSLSRQGPVLNRRTFFSKVLTRLSRSRRKRRKE